MVHTKIARRYAKALFDLAVDQNTLDAVYQDVQALLKVIHSSADLQVFLSDPILSKLKQKGVVERLFSGKVNPIVYQFILFLIDKKRLNYLEEIGRRLDEFYFEYKGMARATITTATPMEPAQLNRLTQKLEASTKKKIVAHEVIDPNILGGFKVQLGDLVSDDSFITQLEDFHRNLINQR